MDSKDALAEQILRLGADLIAERVTASGGLAVALRSPDQWRGGGAGKFVDTQPWIRFELGDTLGAPLVPGRRLSGVRVLDLPSLYEWLSPALGPVSPVAVAPCTGPRHWWGGQLDVEGLALGSVQAALTAANIACTGERLSTDSRAVAAAFASLDHLRVDGRQPVGFAELSGFSRGGGALYGAAALVGWPARR
ncbi:CAIB/BAIF family acyl-CoA transferase [Mycobacteroides abscessus subsp. abscessus]|nr:CAIB/BAIF family acyl-CoA transferase [Mycobacteroides abscessus subsp. abscessus]